jgi:hypothetical protein
MNWSELEHRFTYHPPRSAAEVNNHETIREAARDFAAYIYARIPEGREKAIAITKVEEALYWANAGIARNKED